MLRTTATGKETHCGPRPLEDSAAGYVRCSSATPLRAQCVLLVLTFPLRSPPRDWFVRSPIVLSPTAIQLMSVTARLPMVNITNLAHLSFLLLRSLLLDLFQLSQQLCRLVFIVVTVAVIIIIGAVRI